MFPVSQCVSVMLMSILISGYEPSATLILYEGIFLFSFQLAVFALHMKGTRFTGDIMTTKENKVKAAGCCQIKKKVESNWMNCLRLRPLTGFLIWICCVKQILCILIIFRYTAEWTWRLQGQANVCSYTRVQLSPLDLCLASGRRWPGQRLIERKMRH